ncbi:MAG: mannose-1-phosphate guanylyltransferase [Firmicutes bacterium]|nr:mannose-1-phosphate guanylyltransferase [Bacillota bacterium]
MAGGKGERLWPKSRRSLPKQLLNFSGPGSLIQQTAARIAPLVPPELTFVITGSEYAEASARQLPGLPPENILVEPMGRNTAPCVGLASVVLEHRYPGEDLVMVVLPADHVIRNDVSFREVLAAAISWAQAGPYLVTLGLWPTRPETGYGYIRMGEVLPPRPSEPGQLEAPLERVRTDGRAAYRVEAFIEKPNRIVAQRLLADGRHLWNSGMFVWRLSVIREEIAHHLPELDQSLRRIARAWPTLQRQQVLRQEYDRMPSVSIDYGIMEKAERIIVIPGDFGWDDAGSWTALERLFAADDAGNVVQGKHVGLDTEDCIIYSEDKLVATIGLSGLVVVQAGDALLVCPKERAQDVKQLLQRLKEEGRESYL